jgi:MFS family permease
MKKIFYGWWMVAACMLIATVSWSLGTFGMGVWVFALSSARGMSVTTVSSAVTLAYMTAGLMTLGVGSFAARHGSRPVVAAGAVTLGLAIATLPHCTQTWQIYAAFLALGAGMACLSTITIGTTLAPWFERFQGRAVSTAMLGASIGGMIGTPLLMGGIRAVGFDATALYAGVLVLLLMLPLAAFVLKRRPQDIGQWPDGSAEKPAGVANATVQWTRSAAFATRQFKTHVFAFGVALMVQIGFLTHHVSIAMPVLGEAGAAAAVSAAAIAAFAGRIMLARYADRIDLRLTAAGVFLLSAAALTAIALYPAPSTLMALSVIYGLTVGNITTLSPIVIRREFGAASFGMVFGLAATLTQLTMSLGPSLLGWMREATGSYGPALLLCGALDVLAAAAIVWGGRQPLMQQAA